MKGFSVKFAEGYQGAAAPLSERLMDTIPSSAMLEEYDWLGSFPSIRELVDEVQINNLRAHGFTLRNKEWESTIGLKVTDVIGDRLGLYSRNSQTMGEVARQHPDTLLATLLSNGFTSGTDYTGTAFFATGKVAYTGATAFSNVTTGRLTSDRLATGIANIKNRLNAKGRPMGLGRNLVLVVSPTYEQTAKNILLAEKSANGADNMLRNAAKLEVWPQLAANSMEHTWFLFDVGLMMKPFFRQELLAWQYYAITDPKDSYVVTKKQFLWQVYGVSNVGYCLPELAYGSDGTVA